MTVERMKYRTVLVVAVVLTLAVTSQACTRCGSSGACCSADETCESTVNSGTCYKTRDKTTCNSQYYCYKPRICCGQSYFKTVCCPENSKCCGSITPICCPLNSRCGTFQCYSNSGSSSSSSRSSYSSSTNFGWAYIFIIIPIVGLCVLFGRCIRGRRAAQAQTTRAPTNVCTAFPSGVNRHNPTSSPTNVSAIKTTTLTQTGAGFSNAAFDGANDQPPAYSPPTAYTNGPGPGAYGWATDQVGATMPEPPAYSEIVDVSSPAEVDVQEATAPPEETANENKAYEKGQT